METFEEFKEKLLNYLRVEQDMEKKDIEALKRMSKEEKVEANINSFITENPAWSELTAVKEGRVYSMEKELYTLKPNDRWGEAYEKLEELLAQKQK